MLEDALQSSFFLQLFNFSSSFSNNISFFFEWSVICILIGICLILFMYCAFILLHHDTILSFSLKNIDSRLSLNDIILSTHSDESLSQGIVIHCAQLGNFEDIKAIIFRTLLKRSRFSQSIVNGEWVTHIVDPNKHIHFCPPPTLPSNIASSSSNQTPQVPTSVLPTVETALFTPLSSSQPPWRVFVIPSTVFPQTHHDDSVSSYLSSLKFSASSEPSKGASRFAIDSSLDSNILTYEQACQVADRQKRFEISQKHRFVSVKRKLRALSMIRKTDDDGTYKEKRIINNLLKQIKNFGSYFKLKKQNSQKKAAQPSPNTDLCKKYFNNCKHNFDNNSPTIRINKITTTQAVSKKLLPTNGSLFLSSPSLPYVSWSSMSCLLCSPACAFISSDVASPPGVANVQGGVVSAANLPAIRFTSFTGGSNEGSNQIQTQQCLNLDMLTHKTNSMSNNNKLALQNVKLSREHQFDSIITIDSCYSKQSVADGLLSSFIKDTYQTPNMVLTALLQCYSVRMLQNRLRLSINEHYCHSVHSPLDCTRSLPRRTQFNSAIMNESNVYHDNSRRTVISLNKDSSSISRPARQLNLLDKFLIHTDAAEQQNLDFCLAATHNSNSFERNMHRILSDVGSRKLGQLVHDSVRLVRSYLTKKKADHAKIKGQILRKPIAKFSPISRRCMIEVSPLVAAALALNANSRLRIHPRNLIPHHPYEESEASVNKSKKNNPPFREEKNVHYFVGNLNSLSVHCGKSSSMSNSHFPVRILPTVSPSVSALQRKLSLETGKSNQNKRFYKEHSGAVQHTDPILSIGYSGASKPFASLSHLLRQNFAHHNSSITNASNLSNTTSNNYRNNNINNNPIINAQDSFISTENKNINYNTNQNEATGNINYARHATPVSISLPSTSHTIKSFSSIPLNSSPISPVSNEHNLKLSACPVSVEGLICISVSKDLISPSEMALLVSELNEALSNPLSFFSPSTPIPPDSETNNQHPHPIDQDDSQKIHKSPRRSKNKYNISKNSIPTSFEKSQPYLNSHVPHAKSITSSYLRPDSLLVKDLETKSSHSLSVNSSRSFIFGSLASTKTTHHNNLQNQMSPPRHPVYHNASQFHLPPFHQIFWTFVSIFSDAYRVFLNICSLLAIHVASLHSNPSVLVQFRLASANPLPSSLPRRSAPIPTKQITKQPKSVSGGAPPHISTPLPQEFAVHETPSSIFTSRLKCWASVSSPATPAPANSSTETNITTKVLVLDDVIGSSSSSECESLNSEDTDPENASSILHPSCNTTAEQSIFDASTAKQLLKQMSILRRESRLDSSSKLILNSFDDGKETAFLDAPLDYDDEAVLSDRDFSLFSDYSQEGYNSVSSMDEELPLNSIRTNTPLNNICSATNSDKYEVSAKDPHVLSDKENFNNSCDSSKEYHVAENLSYGSNTPDRFTQKENNQHLLSKNQTEFDAASNIVHQNFAGNVHNADFNLLVARASGVHRKAESSSSFPPRLSVSSHPSKNLSKSLHNNKNEHKNNPCIYGEVDDASSHYHHAEPLNSSVHSPRQQLSNLDNSKVLLTSKERDILESRRDASVASMPHVTTHVDMSRLRSISFGPCVSVEFFSLLLRSSGAESDDLLRALTSGAIRKAMESKASTFSQSCVSKDQKTSSSPSVVDWWCSAIEYWHLVMDPFSASLMNTFSNRANASSHQSQPQQNSHSINNNAPNPVQTTTTRFSSSTHLTSQHFQQQQQRHYQTIGNNPVQVLPPHLSNSFAASSLAEEMGTPSLPKKDVTSLIETAAQNNFLNSNKANLEIQQQRHCDSNISNLPSLAYLLPKYSQLKSAFSSAFLSSADNESSRLLLQQPFSSLWKLFDFLRSVRENNCQVRCLTFDYLTTSRENSPHQNLKFTTCAPTPSSPEVIIKSNLLHPEANSSLERLERCRRPISSSTRDIFSVPWWIKNLMAIFIGLSTFKAYMQVLDKTKKLARWALRSIISKHSILLCSNMQAILVPSPPPPQNVSKSNNEIANISSNTQLPNFQDLSFGNRSSTSGLISRKNHPNGRAMASTTTPQTSSVDMNTSAVGKRMLRPMLHSIYEAISGKGIITSQSKFQNNNSSQVRMMGGAISSHNNNKVLRSANNGAWNLKGHAPILPTPSSAALQHLRFMQQNEPARVRNRQVYYDKDEQGILRKRKISMGNGKNSEKSKSEEFDSENHSETCSLNHELVSETSSSSYSLSESSFWSSSQIYSDSDDDCSGSTYSSQNSNEYRDASALRKVRKQTSIKSPSKSLTGENHTSTCSELSQVVEEGNEGVSETCRYRRRRCDSSDILSSSSSSDDENDFIQGSAFSIKNTFQRISTGSSNTYLRSYSKKKANTWSADQLKALNSPSYSSLHECLALTKYLIRKEYSFLDDMQPKSNQQLEKIRCCHISRVTMVNTSPLPTLSISNVNGQYLTFSFTWQPSCVMFTADEFWAAFQAEMLDLSNHYGIDNHAYSKALFIPAEAYLNYPQLPYANLIMGLLAVAEVKQNNQMEV